MSDIPEQSGNSSGKKPGFFSGLMSKWKAMSTRNKLIFGVGGAAVIAGVLFLLSRRKNPFKNFKQYSLYLDMNNAHGGIISTHSEFDNPEECVKLCEDDINCAGTANWHQVVI